MPCQPRLGGPRGLGCRAAAGAIAALSWPLAQALTITFDSVPSQPADGAIVDGVRIAAPPEAKIGNAPAVLPPALPAPSLWGRFDETGGPVDLYFFFEPARSLSFLVAAQVRSFQWFGYEATIYSGGLDGTVRVRSSAAISASTPATDTRGIGLVVDRTPAVDTLHVRLTLTDGGGLADPRGLVYVFDNLQLTPVPEPASSMLVVAGLGVLWLRRRLPCRTCKTS